MIHLNKLHPFCQGLSHSSVSPYFQEVLVYMGQHTCYEQAGELTEKLLGIKVNAMQIQRLTTEYGAQVGELLERATGTEAITEEQVIYAQVDG